MIKISIKTPPKINIKIAPKITIKKITSEQSDSDNKLNNNNKDAHTKSTIKDNNPTIDTKIIDKDNQPNLTTDIKRSTEDKSPQLQPTPNNSTPITNPSPPSKPTPLNEEDYKILITNKYLIKRGVPKEKRKEIHEWASTLGYIHLSFLDRRHPCDKAKMYWCHRLQRSRRVNPS
ncbi:MAG: hypothetical protein Solumvirus2_62 [Solumvirus sp.]|uniref:Uncharacterized protein n=1 Tax=Solumvirus sp. TaxID=2487773 RepID=A0A3G5AGB5_9VIRU|nr:MAG: hypothetical protein Solumvirus2_62 [Solumvirus sp.]